MGTEAIIASLCFPPENYSLSRNLSDKKSENKKTFCFSHEHRQGIILLSDRAKMEMVRWAPLAKIKSRRGGIEFIHPQSTAGGRGGWPSAGR